MSKADTAALHALERRRDKLLADDKALTVLLAEHPELDVQHLRTLIRNARKEQAENKPPKAYREIFQILKDLSQERRSRQRRTTTTKTTSSDDETRRRLTPACWSSAWCRSRTAPAAACMKTRAFPRWPTGWRRRSPRPTASSRA